MRLLYRCLARLTDEALADSIIGDLEELRRAQRRVWIPALAILCHIALTRLRNVPFVPLQGAAGDFRHAFRVMRRAPGFATAAIAVLALGIGASTAIFSVAYGVSLQPLPYPHGDRLIRVYEANPANGKPKEDVSEPAFHEWRTSVGSIESAAIYSDRRIKFLEGASEQPIVTIGVSPAFFEVLGVPPALGRGFQPERQYTADTRREVVISHGAWQRLFGGDPTVIERTVRFADNDYPWRVVGIMPASFAFDTSVDFWQPFIIRLPVGRITRAWRYDHVVARLRPGVSIDHARAELETVAARLGREFPIEHGGWTVTVESLHQSIVGNFGRISWLLLAAVAVVLAVTYLNVGGLLVARAIAREREMSVRAALGAKRWRLHRLRLAESMVLTGFGTAGGVLLAWWTVRSLRAAAPPAIPRLDAIAVNLPTLAIAALSALVAAVFFTLAPGRVRRSTIHDALRTGSAGSGESRHRHAARLALTVAQCAGAAALVVLAVMLTRSFMQLAAVNLGWHPEGVLSLSTSPPMPRDQRRPWFLYVEWSDRLIARLESTPGIERAAITTLVPLTAEEFAATVARGRGKASGESARWPSLTHHVSDGYFDLMRIRVTAGRTFDRRDRFAEAHVNQIQRAERGVAVVTEATARTLWPGQSAVGQSLWLPTLDNVGWRDVIGTVEDIQVNAVGETPALNVFVPWTQHTTGRPMLLVRGTPDAAAIIPDVRRVVEDVAAGTRVHSVAPLVDLVARSTAQPRFTTQLVAAFGALSLLLAAVGIYGTMSYLVGARMREIGVRLALGARPNEVMAMMLWRGFLPALLGGAVGIGLAIVLGTVFRALLFRVEPADGASIVLGGVVLGITTLVASLGPALRAARVDPTTALRSE
jgi:putative ABC transport system permease protein